MTRSNALSKSLRSVVLLLPVLPRSSQMMGMRPCPSGAFYGQEANTSNTCSESQDVDTRFAEEVFGAIQEQVESDWKTFEDETGNVFEADLEIFNKTMTSFLVTGRMNERVQDGSDLCEVDGSSLD
jgi:hypothetical protein